MGALIITNGDAAGLRMREARIKGDILCWRDILHEGPVPLTETPEELFAIRVQYLIEDGWGDPDEIYTSFAERNYVLNNLDKYSEIFLWFEHDLFDQLQLIQILDYLSRRPELHKRLSLIQAGNYIALESPRRLQGHLKLRRSVTEEQFYIAQAAWSAFRRKTPEAWAGLLRYDTLALPFLNVAIRRHLEELPAVRTGLTRTEKFILHMIHHGGVRTPGELFALFEDYEEAVFMGDWSFWRILNALTFGARPLVVGLNIRGHFPYFDDDERETYLSSALKLTGLGVTSLVGMKDAVPFRRINRWMGGVHLTNHNCWRWDAENQRLTPPMRSIRT
jgi:hypothetical protein